MTNFLHSLALLPFVFLSWYIQVRYNPDSTLKGSDKAIQQPAGSWTQASPLPSARYEFVSGLLNEKIYVVGGVFLPDVWFPTSLAEAYDLKTDTWSRIQNYPRAGHHMGLTVCDNELYVVGGNGLRITTLSDVNRLNVADNTWEKQANMPTARGALGVACLDGKIYAVGGGINKKSTDVMEIYDIKTNTWEKGLSMPTPREHVSAVAANGKIHVLGGYSGDRFHAVTTHEVYDPKTKMWKTLAPLPYPNCGFGATLLGDSIFMFGGEQGWAVSSEVHEYKIKEDKWYRRSDMPMARYALTATTVDDHIHVLGGHRYFYGPNVSQDHDIFTP